MNDIVSSEFPNSTQGNTKPPFIPGKHKWWSALKQKIAHLSKKQRALLIGAIVILVVGGIIGAIYIYKQVTKMPPQPAAQAVVKPTTEPSRLTGVMVDPKLNDRPITGVMIENSLDARPQSGLLNAGVVVEAIAEGGITRFLALYQENQPNYIGPVRSVRPYYLDFILPFQAAVAHVGGSPDGLAQVRALHVRDLDQFANSGAYWRVSNRNAPHNMYTSMKKLDALQKSKGFTKSNFNGFLRNRRDIPVKTIKAKTIDLTISGVNYSVHYDYYAKTNSYLRSEGGAVHRDEKTAKQLSPKVVIALVMSYRIASDGKHSKYGTTGKGTMFVFQSGSVTKGTWHKASRSSQITFTDSAGKPIRLNAGQTWITLVADRGKVAYKP